jgi:hypothetical protein
MRRAEHNQNSDRGTHKGTLRGSLRICTTQDQNQHIVLEPALLLPSSASPVRTSVHHGVLSTVRRDGGPGGGVSGHKRTGTNGCQTLPQACWMAHACVDTQQHAQAVDRRQYRAVMTCPWLGQPAHARRRQLPSDQCVHDTKTKLATHDSARYRREFFLFLFASSATAYY